MKYGALSPPLRDREVTPRAGVWIEINFEMDAEGLLVVTPRAGVWIEISKHPRGPQLLHVTPRAGVWIEIGSRGYRRGYQ